MACVIISSTTSPEELRKSFEKIYGRPYITEEGEKYWIGPRTWIHITPEHRKSFPSLKSSIVFESISLIGGCREIPEKEDPRGFDDLRWGESPEEVKAKHPLQSVIHEKGWDQYIFTIPDVKNALFLKGRAFGALKFRDGKLGYVEILREESTLELIAEMKKQYGPPAHMDKDFYLWQGPYPLIYICPSRIQELPAVKSRILLVPKTISFGWKLPE